MIGWLLFVCKLCSIVLMCEGEVLLGFVRWMLVLCDEVWVVVVWLEVIGKVVIGVLDDYVLLLLLLVLKKFLVIYLKVEI